MKVAMTLSRKIQLTLIGLSAGIIIAWVWESFTCGRCFVSQNLAPVAVLGLLTSAAIGIATARR